MMVSESQTRMRLTDREYIISAEGLKNKAAGQYWRGQATKARKKNLKYILRSIGIHPTQRTVYHLLKFL